MDSPFAGALATLSATAGAVLGALAGRRSAAEVRLAVAALGAALRLELAGQLEEERRAREALADRVKVLEEELEAYRAPPPSEAMRRLEARVAALAYEVGELTGRRPSSS